MVSLHTLTTQTPALQGQSTWPWVEPMAEFEPSLPNGRAWPTISIVTPNYNYADLIELTMRSVLVQGYPELEYIVLDDGSTDSSREIIGRYGDRLAHSESHPNMGQYATINKGFARATGEILGWINSDDIYLPWTLRAVAAIFALHPAVDWVVGHPVRMQQGVVHAVNKLVPYPRALLQAGYFHGDVGGLGWIQQESCFWRRSLWEKAGGLRPEYRYAADYELWTRFAQHADLYAVSTMLGAFTVRGTQNRSIANRDKYMAEVRQVQESIAAGAKGELKDAIGTMRRYERFKSLRGLRGIARRALKLSQFRGPVLKWNFDRAAYDVERRGYFS